MIQGEFAKKKNNIIREEKIALKCIAIRLEKK